ncbi:MAG: VWA domain-containing protein [Acidobacteriota bacterium]|nr:VWA domain-containing protein [Acidobacteriota bacterium]
MLTSLLSGAILLLLTAPQAPQQTPDPQTPQTTFRSGVDRVAVDVIVVDNDGRPVVDLAASEFKLEVDGKARPIASSEFVSLRNFVDPGPPPAHYASNSGGPAGRLIMLVIDQNHIKTGTGRVVFEAATKFIAALNPNDRVGLHLIPGTGPVVDYTANHALVSQMLRQAVGRGSPARTFNARVGLSEAKAIVRNDQGTLREVIERECPSTINQAERDQCQRMVLNDARMVSAEGRSRTAESLVSIRDIMRRMRPGRGRKTLVLLSEGLVLDQGIQDLGWVAPTAAQGQITLFALQMESSGFGAGNSGISPSLAQDRALEREGLDLLAGLSGGAVVPLSTSNPWLGFSRVNTEVSGYYLVSFEPEPAERDGKPHNIKIQTSRRGLTIRARKQFAMDVAPDTASLGARVSEVLQSPLDLTGLGLRIAPYVLADAEGKLKVLITADVDRPAGTSGDAAIGYTLIDQQGRLAGSDLQPSLGEPAGATQHFASALAVDPGIYSLRVGVVDASGREASVGHTFEAKLHSAGQLRWSELVLSEQDPGTARIALLTDGPTGTLLQTYLELYSDVPGMLYGTSVTMEVSRVEGGLALATAPLRFSAAQQTGRRAGEAQLDVGLLGEGQFIARAIISVNGVEAGRVIRPFVIKPKS